MNDSELPQKTEEAAKQRAPKLSAEKSLPKAGADTLVKIIKGYAVASNGGEIQINYKDVASVAGISPTVVSANNAFLLDSQILSSPRYGYYVPSEGATRFAREAAWDEKGAKAHLRRLVLACWFGQVAVQNFALRSTLTRSELKRALAIKSGATEGDSTALEFLMDFLIYTGLVVENDNGSLSKGNLDELMLEGTSLTPERLVQTAAVESLVDAGGKAYSPMVSVVLHLHVHKLEELTTDHAVRLSEWLRAFDGNSRIEVSLDTPSTGAD